MALISQPGSNPVDRFENGQPTEINPGWRIWFVAVFNLLTGLTRSGTTAQRPTATMLRWVGMPYFDTTLGFPIWWDGTVWVDATGAPA